MQPFREKELKCAPGVNVSYRDGVQVLLTHVVKNPDLAEHMTYLSRRDLKPESADHVYKHFVDGRCVADRC